ncbi:MAG: M23 family metallopeptidase [Woeseiaceae bacterium]
MVDLSNNPPRESLFEQTGATVHYPKQTDTPPETGSTYAGELRGYYDPLKKGKAWRPKSSILGARGNDHKGWDIYAPFFEYPLETPVYAVISGQAEVHSGTMEPDGLGHRIWLSAGTDNNRVRFVYGHLNRFNGRFEAGDREVSKGDLIGYAGCTGNADTHGECSNAGALNINSGHVHLQFYANGKLADPIPLLGWDLRFDEDDDLSPAEFAAKYAKFPQPPQKAGRNGLLTVSSVPLTRPTKTAPATKIAKPHHLIDLDDAAAIRRTRVAYASMAARLASKGAKPHRDRGIAKFLESLTRFETLRNAMQEQRTKISGTDPEVSVSETMRLVLNGYLMLWHLFGGAVILAVVRNSKKPKETGGRPPDCGIAMNGRSWVIAVDQGQVALHLTHLYDGSGTKPRKDRTHSVSFGAGTEWHAILDTALFAELDSTLATHELMTSAVQLAGTLATLSDHVYANAARLNSGRKSQMSKEAYALLDAYIQDVVDTLADDIIAVIKRLRDPTKEVENRKAIGELLEALAKTGENACNIALYPFDIKKETIHRITPLVSTMSLKLRDDGTS